MANTKKYISLDKLTKYHGKLVELVNAKDADILQQSKNFATSLGSSYDAAGSAAAVDDKLTTEVARAKAAEEANAASILATQGEVDALETLVGTLPEGKTSVVDYIVERTSGIATDAALSELSGKVTQAEKDIDAIEADYLKAQDKADVVALVEAEAGRATGVENGLAARIKAVEDDYLVAADKTALEGTIADHKAILDEVKADVDAFFLNADMTEGAIDTLKELQAEIAADNTGAAAMAESIQKNKDDIAGVDGRVTTAEGKITTLEGKVAANEGAIADLEALFGEGDGTVADMIADAVKTEKEAREQAVAGVQGAVDAVAGRATTLEGQMTAVQGAVDTKAAQADLAALTGRVTTAEGKVTTLESKMTTVEGKVSTLESEMDAVEAKALANEQAIGATNTEVAKKATIAALEEEVTRAKAAEKANADAIALFVEASEEEVLALFNA